MCEIWLCLPELGVTQNWTCLLGCVTKGKNMRRQPAHSVGPCRRPVLSVMALVVLFVSGTQFLVWHTSIQASDATRPTINGFRSDDNPNPPVDIRRLRREYALEPEESQLQPTEENTVAKPVQEPQSDDAGAQDAAHSIPPPSEVAAPIVHQQSTVFNDLWPGLGSNAAWPAQHPNSCDGYFGNGFDQPFSLLPESVGGKFQCHYHPSLKTHFCDVANVALEPRYFDMVDGGEPLLSVPPRKEREEHPNCSPGAFSVEVTNPQPGLTSTLRFPESYKGWTHDLQLGVYSSFVPVTSRTCAVTVETPTIFVTRFEYHNLFHTSTDWYNVYQVARSLGLPRSNVVYLDGHTQSPMDEVWRAFAANVTWVKHYPPNTCFSRAIFVPFGWHASVSLAITPTKQCPSNDRVREFGDMIDSTNILFVRRVDYKAHPRHQGRLEERLANEEEIYSALQEWADDVPGRAILNGMFHEMSMADQVAMVQQACVIVGAHGAGLSHVLFARKGTQLVELRPPRFRRPHFIGYSKWAGVGYTKWDTKTDRPDPLAVVKLVEEVVRSPKEP